MAEQTYTDILKEMSVGEIRRYPKEEYNRWSQVTLRLYCHGYTYKVCSKKTWDYVEVRRIE